MPNNRSIRAGRHRDRSAQGVLDGCRGELGATTAGHDPGAGQPGRLPHPARVRRPVAQRRPGRSRAPAAWVHPNTWLASDEIVAVDVPAKLAARVRMLSTGHGRKTDDADATSVGIAALTAVGLRTAASRRGDHRVAGADRAPRRRHQDPHPNGQPAARAAHPATARRGTTRPRRRLPQPDSCAHAPAKTGLRNPRRLAVELVAEIRHLDRRITGVNTQDRRSGPAKRQHPDRARGVGTLTAGKILARVGDVHRFRPPAAFASYTGTAPIEVSSGDVVRHRLSRAGDRHLNCCLHIMAITQIRLDGPGRTYYQRKRAERQKPQRSPALPETTPVRHRLPPAPQRRRGPANGGPGRTPGGDYNIQRGRHNPYTDSSDKSLPRPADADTTTTHASDLTQRGAVVAPQGRRAAKAACALPVLGAVQQPCYRSMTRLSL